MADQSDRQTNARRRQELADAAARAEAVQAQRQLDAFVVRMTEAGAQPEPLRALLASGGRARTALVGWYVNAARTIAVTPDGGFYRLVVPGSALSRLTGVTLSPSEPVTVIGRGGRDGETGDLADFLERAFVEYSAR